MPDSVLSRGLESLGLADRVLADDLLLFQTQIETWNQRLGLVSLKSADDLVVKHLLDSLAPWSPLKELGFTSLVDLGSGAGFPGIPLALVFRQARTVLVERMERRAGFLEATLAVLNRSDVVVLQRTFEEVRDGFDLVTFRAFTPLEPKVVKKMKRLLNPHGHIAAYKGRREVIDAELAALGDLAAGAQIVPLKVPFLDEERHLVVIPA